MHTRQVPVLFTAILMIFGALFYSHSYSATLFYSETYSATEPLSVEEETDLLFMREEEKLARDVYLTFYEIWDLQIFSNIASSEQMHMNALLKLLKKYDLEDPAADNEIGEFTDSDLQTLYAKLIAAGMAGPLEALMVGGTIEEKDMVDIQEAIERSDHADIDLVYESLLCGSRNHLRAFAQAILTQFGVTYTLQWDESDPAQIEAILTSPMEKCGKNATPAKVPAPSSKECKGKCLGWSK